MVYPVGFSTPLPRVCAIHPYPFGALGVEYLSFGLGGLNGAVCIEFSTCMLGVVLHGGQTLSVSDKEVLLVACGDDAIEWSAWPTLPCCLEGLI